MLQEFESAALSPDEEAAASRITARLERGFEQITGAVRASSQAGTEERQPGWRRLFRVRLLGSRPASAAAFALAFAMLLIVFNLPINAEQSNWAVQAPPADWASVRDRWQIAHAVRTSAAVLAFGCLSTAAMGTSAINLLDHSRTDRRSPATWDSVLHQGGRA